MPDQPLALSPRELRAQTRRVAVQPPLVLPEGKRIYVASDLHLGVPTAEASLARERRFVRWLDSIRADAGALILLGDVFDFWFEYRTVAPKGHVRLLGKLAELADAGIPITYFVGNHDLWLRDYLPAEIGLRVAHHPEVHTWFDRRYFLAHGDGLGPGDRQFKFFRGIFVHPFFNWLFRVHHPDFAIGIAHYFSRRSAQRSRGHDQVDYGDREHLYQFVQALIADGQTADHYVFGHRHHAKRRPMTAPDGRAAGELIVIGDWLSTYTYLEVTPSGPELKAFGG